MTALTHRSQQISISFTISFTILFRFESNFRIRIEIFSPSLHTFSEYHFCEAAPHSSGQFVHLGGRGSRGRSSARARQSWLELPEILTKGGKKTIRSDLFNDLGCHGAFMGEPCDKCYFLYPFRNMMNIMNHELFKKNIQILNWGTLTCCNGT